MRRQLEPLFTPWKIGNCEIKNRIVLTSMGGTNLLGWMEKNHFDKDGGSKEQLRPGAAGLSAGVQPHVRKLVVQK